MAWFEQLDNNGKKTGYKRFFTEAEQRGLNDIQKKTKRVRWVVSNEEIVEQKKNVVEPPKFQKTITLMDVHECENTEGLEQLLLEATTNKVKNAIKEKIKSLKNK